MAKLELLNNIDHKDVKIDTTRSAGLGDNIWYTPTFPGEFRSVQAHYPIFIQKDSNTGQFIPVAVFGFEHEDNLFLTESGWDAGYIPLTVLRQPFMIGSQKQSNGTSEEENRVLTINTEHPRVNTEKGEALFLEFGGNSPFLDRIADMMETLHHGMIDNSKFISCLNELELIEPFTLEVQLNDASMHQMVGFYTINEEKIASLTDQQKLNLMNTGYMQAIYMVLASQHNVSHLLKRKNIKLGL